MGAEIPDGAFVVARAILNSSLWTMRAEDCKVAVTLIGLANWKERKWFDGKLNVSIKRGQLIRSLDDMAASCHVSLQVLRTSLKNLEKCGFLTRQSTQRYTIITIPKYDKYQDLTRYADKEWPKDLTRSLTDDQLIPNTSLTNGQHMLNNKQEGIRRMNKGKKGEEAPSDFPDDATASSTDEIRAYATSVGIYAASDSQFDSIVNGLVIQGYTLKSLAPVMDLNKGKDILKIDFGAGPPRPTYSEISREEDVSKVELWLDGWIEQSPRPFETRIGNRWYVQTPEGNYKYSRERTEYWVAEYGKGNGNG